MEKNNKEELKQKVETKVDKAVEEVKEKHHHSGGFGAIFLLIIGVILLFNNFGVLPWGIWETLWKFWPLILIFGGLEALFGKNWISRFVIGILALVTLLAIVGTVVSNYNQPFNSWVQNRIPSFKQFKKSMPYMMNGENINLEDPDDCGCEIDLSN